jgi:hypothetical protein
MNWNGSGRKRWWFGTPVYPGSFYYRLRLALPTSQSGPEPLTCRTQVKNATAWGDIGGDNVLSYTERLFYLTTIVCQFPSILRVGGRLIWLCYYDKRANSKWQPDSCHILISTRRKAFHNCTDAEVYQVQKDRRRPVLLLLQTSGPSANAPDAPQP